MLILTNWEDMSASTEKPTGRRTLANHRPLMKSECIKSLKNNETCKIIILILDLKVLLIFPFGKRMCLHTMSQYCKSGRSSGTMYAFMYKKCTFMAL